MLLIEFSILLTSNNSLNLLLPITTILVSNVAIIFCCYNIGNNYVLYLSIVHD